MKHEELRAVIVDMGQAHGGDVMRACDIISEYYEAGADIIKFQVHVAEDHNPSDPLPPKLKDKFKNRGEYWSQMALKDYEPLINHCFCLGLPTCCSIFGKRAAELIEYVNYAKIAAHQWNDPIVVDWAQRSHDDGVIANISHGCIVDHTIPMVGLRNEDNPWGPVTFDLEAVPAGVGVSLHSSEDLNEMAGGFFLWKAFMDFDLVEVHAKDEDTKEIDADYHIGVSSQTVKELVNCRES